MNIVRDKTEYPIEISRWGVVDTPFTAQLDDPIPLRYTVTEWLKENCSGSYTTYWQYMPNEYPKTLHFIRFKNQEDAIAFKLRWF